MSSAYEIWVGKPQGKNLPGCFMCRQEDNNVMQLGDYGRVLD
jgi:hypothetical protein